MGGKREELSTLCERHGLELMYAFGSRGEEARQVLEGAHAYPANTHPDLDIGVLPAGGKTLSVRDKASLAVELEEFFRVSRVDLVSLPEADPFLAANIIRGELLFCADVHRANEYELYVLRRAGDLAPLEQERLSLLQER
jgi:hypothetical protein